MQILKKGLLTCLTVMTMSVGFLTSCSDDEDLEKVVTVITAAEAVDFEGTRLTAVGGEGKSYPTKFIYNDDGTLSQIEREDSDSDNHHEKVVFDYASGTITSAEMSYGEYTEDKGHFTTNEKGYITEISISGSDETYTYKYQYNSADHLIKVTTKGISTYDDGHTNTVEKTLELTWNGDLLSSITVNGSQDINNEKDGWVYNYNFSYDDAVDNRFMQYTDNILIYFDFHGRFEDFLLVGLCGKGPSKYPSNIEEIEYGKVDNSNLIYKLNSKGLVEKETIVWKHEGYDDTESTIYYSYDGISKAAAPAAGNKAGVDKKRNKDSRNHISLFRSKK